MGYLIGYPIGGNSFYVPPRKSTVKKKIYLTPKFISIKLRVMSTKHDYVESLGIQAGTRYRSDCPFCGHRNSFAASNDGTHTTFKCFHADCNAKGSIRNRLSSTVASKALLPKQNKQLNQNSFELPDTFVDVSRSKAAMNYLNKVQVMDAYLNRKVRLMYDQRLDRVVYLIYHGSHIVDAVGRSLSGAKPKWYRYGKSKQMFTAGDSRLAVLVEDCASASCISHLVTGVAMLGTSLLKEHIAQLKKFDKVYVALDKDATKLGLKTVRTLKSYINVHMLILEDDLKNMQKGKLDEFIRTKVTGDEDTPVCPTQGVL